MKSPRDKLGFYWPCCWFALRILWSRRDRQEGHWNSPAFRKCIWGRNPWIVVTVITPWIVTTTIRRLLNPFIFKLFFFFFQYCSSQRSNLSSLRLSKYGSSIVSQTLLRFANAPGRQSKRWKLIYRWYFICQYCICFCNGRSFSPSPLWWWA